MTRHPYGPDELDRHDPALDDTAARLEEYASAIRGEPPMDLAARIRTAIEAEPPVVMGWWATFLAWRHGVPARAVAVAGVVVLAVAGALALGELARNARFDNVGTSPEPSAVPSSTATEEPTPSLYPSPTDLPSAVPSPTVAPTPTERETVEPSHDDDGAATPTPSESDHSGPGGGGSESGSGSSGSGSSGSGSDD